MSKFDSDPSLAYLALQYGTINKAQFKQVTSLLPHHEKDVEKEAELLLKQGLATRYQINLLKLILDYQTIRKKGEEFGRLAVEKGFATAKEIKAALDIQREAFRKARLKKLIGDILVESGVITAEQKVVILREQTLLVEKTRQILSPEPHNRPGLENEVDLTGYEKEFLKIKALDQDFSSALLEKGIVSEQEISHASAVQEEAFEKENAIKILGDIMVDLHMISLAQKEIILEAQGRMGPEQNEPQIRIEVSPDKMSAWAYLGTSDGSVTLQDIKITSDRAGVIQGRFSDAFVQAALDAGLTAIPIAKKDYSRALKETRQLVSYLETDLSDKGEKKKGDVLVAFHSDRQYGPCTNVLGEVSEFQSDRDFTIRSGAGTKTSRDKTKILAMKTGIPGLSLERKLYIHPTIHVLEDVDQRYGTTEAFANLVVSGTITGANPVKAGSIKAREIRGGRIEAIGDIHCEVGITDAVIRCQGSIRARYLHNCTLELFGNLYVENEIFDSVVNCSGKIDSPSCRAVSSYLGGKQGVVLAGVGSERTRPCRISAGTEAHLILQVSRILSEIETVRKAGARMDEKIGEVQRQARKTFEKMVELKIFHDRAKKTKQILVQEYKSKSQAYTPKKIKNIENLLENLDGRMERSIQTLKELNTVKKKADQAHEALVEKKRLLAIKIEHQVRQLEQTLFAYLEWARSQERSPVIEIKGKAFQGTIFRGVWAEKTLMTDEENLMLQEEGAYSGSELRRL